jgi:hypothetical protein
MLLNYCRETQTPMWVEQHAKATPSAGLGVDSGETYAQVAGFNDERLGIGSAAS